MVLTQKHDTTGTMGCTSWYIMAGTQTGVQALQATLNDTEPKDTRARDKASAHGYLWLLPMQLLKASKSTKADSNYECGAGILAKLGTIAGSLYRTLKTVNWLPTSEVAVSTSCSHAELPLN